MRLKKLPLAAALLGQFAFAQPAVKELAVLRPTLHRGGEDGAAIPASYQYIGGEPMYLSFRVAGFKDKKDLVEVRFQIYATDPQGVLLFEPLTGKIDAELTDNDREKGWMPVVRQTLTLPPLLGPGQHNLRIRVADEHGGKTAEANLPFTVFGRTVKAAELAILEFGFFANENSTSPMVDPEYKAGEAVVARFLVAGYATGEKNRFDIGYGIQILRPDGSLFYEEKEAARESDTPFYPKKWLQGGVNLTSQAGTPPGMYTIVVKARDAIGGKVVEGRYPFRLK